MKKYIVTIEETVAQDFEICVHEDEDPLQIAENKYKSGEIILSPGEAQYRQMAVTSPNIKPIEWVKF